MIILKINGKRRRVNENIILTFKAIKYLIYSLLAYTYAWFLAVLFA